MLEQKQQIKALKKRVKQITKIIVLYGNIIMISYVRSFILLVTLYSDPPMHLIALSDILSHMVQN